MPTRRKDTAFGRELVRRKTGLRRRLMHWYRRDARDLPWRGTEDPYVVWVTETVLQQTRVAQGTPYIERLLETFPSVDALAAAHEDHVLKLWEGLGYYSRARNLHKAAKRIVDHDGGRFPASAAEWERLPGVGPYTAGAIASIVLGEQVPVVDGNVRRVLARLLNLTRCIDDAMIERGLWDLMGQLVKGVSPGDFNQAVMELGARICTPKAPDCSACPVQSHCAAFEAGTQTMRPIRRKKPAIPHYDIVVAVIRKNGRYLIGKRPSKGLLGGLWEFPGGKVEAGETHAQALRREVKEEVGIRVRPRGLVASVDHAYSHFKVTLNVYRCDPLAGVARPKTHTKIKWVRPAEFDDHAFPTANRKFLHLL